MNRQQAKELLPIIQAFAEGKAIQSRYINGSNTWLSDNNLSFGDGVEYRIKPEPKYRPFKDVEECWQEMLKHQPFGWIKDKQVGNYVLITKVDDNEDVDGMSINGNNGWHLSGLMEFYTFADGTPFGIKEE